MTSVANDETEENIGRSRFYSTQTDTRGVNKDGGFRTFL